MTGKTIRVKENTHSTFFSIQKQMGVKSSDECLKIIMIYWYDTHQANVKLEEIYRGMYQIEEKQIK